ncbi:DUF1993 domain-containing protein [Paucibacter sp. APW11]|uniref:DUF1993 domain-containing protein n=1 Tax=Roseateles aquae TaxID=3077235 RepID=A0ABU3P9L5_9BURK|nr:DUF1993 domain-containing protein [Paucibacter sp. APW11]MDT8999246.1 DUF1993 domain-containing protein [Paucibacter sp. APW11]
MNTASLWATTVPVFQRYLGQLRGWLDLAEARLDGPALASLLQSRLAPDMHPLASQIEIACNFVPRALAPLLGQAQLQYGDFKRDLPGLRARLQARLALLQTLRADELDARPLPSLVHFDAGQALGQLAPADYIHQFALPNFFFHLSLAYALLRQAGLPLGKADFDGLHRYGPADLSPATTASA